MAVAVTISSETKVELNIFTLGLESFFICFRIFPGSAILLNILDKQDQHTFDPKLA